MTSSTDYAAIPTVTYDLPNAENPAGNPPAYSFHPTPPPRPSLVPCYDRPEKRMHLVPSNHISYAHPVAGGAKLVFASKVEDIPKRRIGHIPVAATLFSPPNISFDTWKEHYLPHCVTLQLAPLDSQYPFAVFNPSHMVRIVPSEKNANFTEVTMRYLLAQQDDLVLRKFVVAEKIAVVYKKIDPEGWERSVQLSGMTTFDFGGGNRLTDAFE
ncbi:hypothetical protein HK097_007860 [Rhizophlyctis rosea]|uniref:Uncharacterized protein n=1 Tax=Rhizophlyctis rosea TaxID=64517 RepID=A0AAD5SB34_9FUNG|nr:hypothetical protein HK097_007860 [Rhizophlyctis rosea]